MVAAAPDGLSEVLRAAPNGLIELLRFAQREAAGDERKWAGDVLLVVIAFLRAIGVNPELMKPLRDLLFALLDSDRGIQNELTAPVRLKGRPPKSSKEVHEWARAAAEVTLLIKKKTPEGVAVGKVAKQSRFDAKKLREYRKNIQRRRASKREQRLYQWYLEELNHPDLTSHGRKQFMLGVVSELWE